jgi:hypothetical protein
MENEQSSATENSGNDQHWRGSPILVAFEAVFRWLARGSLVPYLFSTRGKLNSLPEGEDQRVKTRRRMRQIDCYITGWVLFETCLIAAVIFGPPWMKIASVVIATYRIIEIVQSASNLVLFDRLRGHRNRVAVAERIVVILVINFFELILCFGVIYAHNKSLLVGTNTWYDPYYFSVVVQTTLGFGDILPKHGLQVVSAIQALIGTLFGVVLISRFIGLLPKIESDKP